MAMNGFTSGTQALQGRKVNHDPVPWDSAGWRYPSQRYGTPVPTYAPRPEFDVLDNPILAEFRRAELPLQPDDTMHAIAAFWAHVLAHRGGWAPADATQAHVDHAIRVFQKLAALNA